MDGFPGVSPTVPRHREVGGVGRVKKSPSKAKQKGVRRVGLRRGATNAR